MPNCAVEICGNNNRNTKGTNIIYHQFPKAVDVCSAWVHACKRQDKINLTHARVCSDHFCESDYVRDLKSELLKTETKRRLKETAVPSVNLSKQQNVTPLETTPPITQNMLQIKEEPEEYNEYSINDTQMMQYKEENESISFSLPVLKYETEEFIQNETDSVYIKQEEVFIKEEEIFPDKCLDEDWKFCTICKVSHSVDNHTKKTAQIDMPISDQNKKSHNQENKEVSIWTCNLCNKLFSEKNKLNEHMETHTRNRPFVCSLCNKSFFRKGDLLSHVRTHTGDRPFSCDLCNKSFTQSSTLVAHTRIHTGARPFFCDICNQSFSRNSILNAHKRLHTGDRRFSCNICKKLFTRNSHLIAHMVTHTGDRPFSCDVCCKTFSRKDSLTLHMRSHIDNRPFTCDTCDRSFSRKYLLKKHVQRSHID
ncbi:hypothetical protein C0J52_20172 [Blattella germanica]|nr:hypothetical protein C0J52_20172 [Blattella germanica]